MPLARAIPRIVTVLVVVALSACAMEGMPTRAEFMRMPLAVRTGAANSVIERVESSVDRAEVADAVQALVYDAPLCYPWPGLWLDASTRRNVYFARFDLMSRDWGDEVTSASRQRMQEFVELGFLSARERPDIGSGAVEYTLTEDGATFLRGTPYGGARPQFCPNAQRRVVDVTDMQWGQYQCGSLHVRFTHVADNWPSWARTESARQRVDATWTPIGVPGHGEVTLSRQWFRSNLLPSSERNGALKSLCLDASQNVTGDDLNLNAPPQ